MSRQSDYDVDLFAEMVRSGKFVKDGNFYDLGESKPDEEKAKPESKTQI
jgi:hypothetical protein